MNWIESLLGNDAYPDYNNRLTELAQMRERDPFTQDEIANQSSLMDMNNGFTAELPFQDMPYAQHPGSEEDGGRGRRGGVGRGHQVMNAPQLSSTSLPGLMNMSSAQPQKDPFIDPEYGELLEYLNLMSWR